MGTIFFNPLFTVVEPVKPVALSRPQAVRMFFVITFVVPVEFLLVMNRPVISTAAVMFCLDALFGNVFTMASFPAVGPGSTGEYKYQRCNQHTDFQKCLFHGLASFG